MRVSRTLPNVPFVVASSCASDRYAHASSKRRFAQRLYVKKSGSPVVMALISFYDLFSNNTREETMGKTRGDGEEQVIACTAGSNLLCATGQETAYIGLGCGLSGNISYAQALDPCLTPVCRVLLHTCFPPSHACFPIRRLSLAQ